MQCHAVTFLGSWYLVIASITKHATLQLPHKWGFEGRASAWCHFIRWNQKTGANALEWSMNFQQPKTNNEAKGTKSCT